MFDTFKLIKKNPNQKSSSNSTHYDKVLNFISKQRKKKATTTKN